ncbi:shikimate dehydrogenase [Marichromatium bheemlicum]|uniref:Shikimate dehydrogenase (NADP(+)) n=1 Tax=Marichromatium bheemlicum TaxID=365339 RepID=A0ABX1I8Z4_9GAMM|nr:shikimate dehydrogenase [Marichromatium bheemlicum]NKN32845.1 shikimate dehydrogenase [Marichromatium bheemlicum]
MPHRYAVIGNPIAHSQSPVIHAAFAEQCGEVIDYGRILGDRHDFAADVQRFFAQGGLGLNVTLPFKEQAWALVDERSERAEVAGAVNTLIVLPDGRLRGDNTDGIGLVRDLADNHGFTFAGARVLLLGAGGAARGVLVPLLGSGLRELVIANRTAERAHTLAVLGSGSSTVPVAACGFEGLIGERFDLVINATSAGLSGAVPPIPADLLAPGGWTYDMLYGAEPTAFCRWGQAHGAARSLDGLGMLVEQAAESFRLWRGVRPRTAEVIAMLRAAD